MHVRKDQRAKGWRFRVWRVFLACVVLVLSLFTIVACQPWGVTPPSGVQNPARVYLSEHGKHSSVSFPEGEKLYVEFGFGEWFYYGHEQHGLMSSIRAISGGGKGALSRREFPVMSLEDAAFAEAAGASRSVGIDVEASKMLDLKERLEARWLASHSIVVRSHDRIEVRQDPQGYYLFRNSNAVSADWLREMGVEVRGSPVWSNFRMVE